MTADALNAVVQNAVGLATALGILANAILGVYTAWKQLQLHAKVDALTNAGK